MELNEKTGHDNGRLDGEHMKSHLNFRIKFGKHNKISALVTVSDSFQPENGGILGENIATYPDFAGRNIYLL